MRDCVTKRGSPPGGSLEDCADRFLSHLSHFEDRVALVSGIQLQGVNAVSWWLDRGASQSSNWCLNWKLSVGTSRMSNKEETGSPGWSASFFMQTTEDVTKGPKLLLLLPLLFILHDHIHRSLKEPSRLFKSMVVVGLHPNCDIKSLKRQYIARKSETPGKLQTALNYQNQSRVEPNIEPQVLFVYPREKQLPLKNKDLLSYCFPGGFGDGPTSEHVPEPQLDKFVACKSSNRFGATIGTEEIVNEVK
ncbi:hypothetical protein Dsin_000975 [Dipteronia sinensis]|uniref:Uncharacterized protein n=1 Tax=Dipteronia sinensis TaxID=43782 RepID=A0AAE0B4G9_9ROSI|nr:hypothetical protein Dsin_000975 [Dipteronia sinensis]